MSILRLNPERMSSMFLGNMNQSNTLTIFSLFFGTVGVGFAIMGESQYTMISLIIAAVGYLFSYRFTAMFEQTDDQVAYAIELENLSKAVVYALLPVSLLISISYASLFSVVVGSLYMLAVIIRLAYFNQSLEYQGEQDPQSTQGLPLEVSALVIPIVGLLGYIIPLSIFQFILAFVFIALAAGFILNIPVPKLPEKWLIYTLGVALLLVIAYLFLGSLTAI